jgi:hypothetical protein
MDQCLVVEKKKYSAGYAISNLRYHASNDPRSVIEASAVEEPGAPGVDRAMTAVLAFPNDVTGSFRVNFNMPPRWGLVPQMPEFRVSIKCEGGEVELNNFVGPSFYHSITVKRKDARGNVTTTTEKAYVGERGDASWTTYRHQLEAFVDKVRGRQPQHWFEAEDSVSNLHWIEQVYAKVCIVFVLFLFRMVVCLPLVMSDSRALGVGQHQVSWQSDKISPNIDTCGLALGVARLTSAFPG